MDRIRSGKVTSPAKRWILPDFGDEALHTRALFVYITQAFAVTKAWAVNQIHVNCMANKVIADFGGLDYSVLKFSSIVLPERAGQVYLQEIGLSQINSKPIKSRNWASDVLHLWNNGQGFLWHEGKQLRKFSNIFLCHGSFSCSFFSHFFFTSLFASTNHKCIAQFGMSSVQLTLCVVTTNKTNLNFALVGIAVDSANCSHELAVHNSWSLKVPVVEPDKITTCCRNKKSNKEGLKLLDLLSYWRTTLNTRTLSNRRAWVGGWVVGPRSRCIHVVYTYFYAVSNALSQQRFYPRSLSNVDTEWLLKMMSSPYCAVPRTFQIFFPTASLIFPAVKLFHKVIWERTKC